MARQQVTIDPAVAAIIKDTSQRQRRRRMPQAQRAQAKRDAKRRRVTWEVEPHVAQIIEQIAEEEGCSPASVVNLLVCDAVGRYVAGELAFNGNRRPSRSPRYNWVVELNGRAEALQVSLEDALESRGR